MYHVISRDFMGHFSFNSQKIITRKIANSHKMFGKKSDWIVSTVSPVAPFTDMD